MEHRLLGHGALQVSAIGLGCMSMSGTYGKSDDAAAIAVIHRALELGIDFLDSSDMYGWGHNEELLRRALAGRREGVVLATKFGQVRSPDGGGNLVNGSAAYVRTACEASLKRLGVDTIDLYYQHRVDPKVPIEETVAAMARLREEGKIRALGLCEAAPTTLRRAHAVHPIAALQMEYSLLYRQPAEDALAVCRELGVAFVAYSPLGRSLLAGGVERPEDIPTDDRRRQHPRFQGPNLEHNARLVRRLAEIARPRGATPAQLALAWLLARGRDVVPIPGTKRVDRLEENAGAVRIRLDAEDLRQIDEAMPPGAGAGTRYPEPQMKGVYI
jgi:aryl-alcohol dehydrogenase-like predicted oxidoreductase